jgi:hypothetical protein
MTVIGSANVSDLRDARRKRAEVSCHISIPESLIKQLSEIQRDTHAASITEVLKTALQLYAAVVEETTGKIVDQKGAGDVNATAKNDSALRINPEVLRNIAPLPGLDGIEVVIIQPAPVFWRVIDSLIRVRLRDGIALGMAGFAMSFGGLIIGLLWPGPITGLFLPVGLALLWAAQCMNARISFEGEQDSSLQMLVHAQRT